MVPLRDTITTSGDGYWSDVIRSVKLRGYTIPYINEEQDFGELRVYFYPETWNTNEDGLIYTDSAFLEHIRVIFGSSDIDYSEQGMQGSNFVSFDVGVNFLKECV